MDRTLFNRDGRPVAYLHEDYHGSIFLWDGHAVAYLYDDMHVYGLNGRHLGWFLDDILYTNGGGRIGFTASTCPVPLDKEPAKIERRVVDQIRPRWSAPPTPKLDFHHAEQDLEEFLRGGEIPPFTPQSELDVQ